jgi:predicted transglutaminase-like cysteine proteinase
MKPHSGSRNPGSLAVAALLAISVASFVESSALAADRASAGDTTRSAESAANEQNAPHTATFFTINAVLAKLERQRGSRPDAVRLAALPQVSASAIDAEPQPSVAPPVGSEPFGLFTFRAPQGALWRKWEGVEADMAREKLVLEGCRDSAENCPSYAAQFLRLIKAVKSKSGRAQLEQANLSVNAAIHYVSDLVQFGELDRWSAPLASFASAKGDCEDYAIAKYVALREAGFPEGELRLLLGRDRTVRQDHAVLAARLDGRWLILDNRWSELRDDSADMNFTPLFAIDHAGVFLLAKPYAKLEHSPASEVEAAPAAASDVDLGEWSGPDQTNDNASGLNCWPIGSQSQGRRSPAN